MVSRVDGLNLASRRTDLAESLQSDPRRHDPGEAFPLPFHASCPSAVAGPRERVPGLSASVATAKESAGRCNALTC